MCRAGSTRETPTSQACAGTRARLPCLIGTPTPQFSPSGRDSTISCGRGWCPRARGLRGPPGGGGRGRHRGLGRGGVHGHARTNALPSPSGPRPALRSLRHRRRWPRNDQLRPRRFIVTWETTRACALACVHCRAEAIPQRHPEEAVDRGGISPDRSRGRASPASTSESGTRSGVRRGRTVAACPCRRPGLRSCL
jgi:hypothetical protein